MFLLGVNTSGTFNYMEKLINLRDSTLGKEKELRQHFVLKGSLSRKACTKSKDLVIWKKWNKPQKFKFFMDNPKLRLISPQNGVFLFLNESAEEEEKS